jgi:hypothetical protein
MSTSRPAERGGGGCRIKLRREEGGGKIEDGRWRMEEEERPGSEDGGFTS